MVPKEIREADIKIADWTYYTKDGEPYLAENTPEEIKKLKKKSDAWWKKHPIIMN